jgi:anti-sigma factor RsiW
MSGLDNETLQRLFDEELDAPEAEEARKALAESAQDAKRLASLAQMRALIRAEAEAAAEAADFDGLWPAVAARIRQGDRAAPAEPAEATPGALARFKAWLGASMGQSPMRWAAAGVCAVAAAVALGVLISSSLAPGTSPPKQTAARIEASDNVDIEKMEFKGRHPDIFQIKDGKRTTTVIWVYPEDEDEDDSGADNGDDPGSSDPI